MSVKLFMDVHVHGAVTQGLRRRGVDVMTAQEDGTRELPDPALLDRAASLGRVLFTHDTDFLQEAHRRLEAGEAFFGVIFAHQRSVDIGAWIDDLELIASVGEPSEYQDRVVYLPL